MTAISMEERPFSEDFERIFARNETTNSSKFLLSSDMLAIIPLIHSIKYCSDVMACAVKIRSCVENCINGVGSSSKNCTKSSESKCGVQLLIFSFSTRFDQTKKTSKKKRGRERKMLLGAKFCLMFETSLGFEGVLKRPGVASAVCLFVCFRLFESGVRN